MVMLNGRLYDAKTLNEIGNHPRSARSSTGSVTPSER